MKQVGIWIDKREAIIVSIDRDGNHHIETIESNIEDYNVKGGSGSRSKYGPQDVVQDSKYMEREKHQLSKYFNEIVKYIRGAEEIVIIGPAQTGEKLKSELNRKYPNLLKRLKSVEKMDNLTKNQLVAWVKKFFTTED